MVMVVLSVFFGWLGLTFHLAKLPTVGIFIYLAIKVFKQLVLSLLGNCCLPRPLKWPLPFLCAFDSAGKKICGSGSYLTLKQTQSSNM
jgi:hypothetical protein